MPRAFSPCWRKDCANARKALPRSIAGSFAQPGCARFAAATASCTSSPEAQEFVAETRQLARLLQADYAADAQLPPERLPNVVAMREQRRLWSSTQWGSLAAALAIFAVKPGFCMMPLNSCELGPGLPNSLLFCQQFTNFHLSEMMPQTVFICG